MGQAPHPAECDGHSDVLRTLKPETPSPTTEFGAVITVKDIFAELEKPDP